MKRMLFSACALLAAGTLQGANLYSNPGYETWDETLNRPTPNKWQIQLPKDDPKTFSVFGRDDKVFHSGKYSLHLKDDNTSPINNFVGYIIGTGESKRLAGKNLYFSAWVKQAKASSPDAVGISIWYKTKSGKIGDVLKTTGTTGPMDWKQLKIKADLPKDTNLIFVKIHCASGFGRTGEAWFDDLLLTNDPDEAAGKPPKIRVKANSKKKKAPPTPDEADKSPLWDGHKYLSIHPLPNSWKHHTWGGFGWETNPLIVDFLHLKMPKGVGKFGGITIGTDFANRKYDLSKIPVDELKVAFKMNLDIPVNLFFINGTERTKLFTLKGKKLSDETFLYEKKLSAFQFKPDEIARVQLQFPEGIPAGILKLWDYAFYTKNPVGTPPGLADGKSASAFRDIYAKEITFTAKKAPVEIKNGTFYLNGKPEMFVGPWIGCNTTINWGKGKNPLNIDHIAYTDAPGKKVFDAVGFNSAQISAAWSVPGQALFGLGIPENWKEKEAEFQEYFKRFENIPMVLDFAFGFVSALAKDNPEKALELKQHNPDWHAFIPYCPEHPEGDRYYKCYMEGGLKNALKNGGNIMGYELFNESSYNCRCRYNTADFAGRMKKKYGSIENANKVWNTIFDDWKEVSEQTNFQQYKKLWPDWCKFSADRYAEILKKYADFIRTIDKRPGIWFSEQSSSTNIYKQRGAGMDYRRIAEVLDVLALEGGWKYGRMQSIGTTSDMEAVVVAGSAEHSFICDFYSAVSKGVKPVTNNEHYCWRTLHGKRVPSRRMDMVTSLWTELLHGSSANYTYVWDKRVYEARTMEQAKANVEQISYKSSSMLNPFNWPPSDLDGFKVFRNELEPYREKILPFPRTKAPTVGVFYSYPTLRMLCYHRFDFSKRMFDTHSALLNSQYPLKIVFEEDLKNPPKEIRAIIVPCANYATPETIADLNKFVKKGGLVVADAEAFQWDERGNTLSVKGAGFIKYNAGTPKVESELSGILKKAKIPRYGAIEPLDGKALAGTDFQMIDRGDFKLVYVVNFGDISTRKVKIKIFIDPKEGEFVLADIFAKRELLPGTGKRWNAKNLAEGFLFALPPQERVVLILEKKVPTGLKPFSAKDMEQFYKERFSMEKPILDKFEKEEKTFQKEYAENRFWTGVNPKKCKAVNISKFVNMGFADKVSGDKTGGWFDQGSNDFAKMPIGRQTFANVPFHIINPDQNGGKGVIVLYSTNRTYFPKAVKNIPVDGKAKYIYFLHTYGWNPRKGEKVLLYRLHYTDGTSVEIPMISGKDIGEWWGAKSLPNAKIAVESANLMTSKINMQCYRWKNPHPGKKIRSLDLESALSSGVPAVAGITVEAP